MAETRLDSDITKPSVTGTVTSIPSLTDTHTLPVALDVLSLMGATDVISESVFIHAAASSAYARFVSSADWLV